MNFKYLYKGFSEEQHFLEHGLEKKLVSTKPEGTDICVSDSLNVSQDPQNSRGEGNKTRLHSVHTFIKCI